MIDENRWEILKSKQERFEISRKKKLTGKNKMQDVLTKKKIEANLWFVCRISTLPFVLSIISIAEWIWNSINATLRVKVVFLLFLWLRHHPEVSKNSFKRFWNGPRMVVNKIIPEKLVWVFASSLIWGRVAYSAFLNLSII